MNDLPAAPRKHKQKKRKPLTIRAMIWTLLRVALLVYGGLTLLLFFVQRSLLYLPSRASEAELSKRAKGYGLRAWREDGGFIGWRHAAPSHARFRMLVFGGNAGHALDRRYLQQGFESLDGRLWEVFLFEYPGYGARPGSPSQAAFVDAALQAFDGLRREDDRPIFLVGESLGGGVAAQVASRRPSQVAGLCFITPFNNLADVAAFHYPMFPVRLLLRDRFASDEALKSYRGPLATLLAGRDGVVPARFGRRLFDGYDGPKRLWVQEDNDHNTLDLDPDQAWWRQVSDFLHNSQRNSQPAAQSSR